MLFADRHVWPDAMDLLSIAVLIGSVLTVAAVGYVWMFIDFRRYLRSLKRTLIVVANYLPHIPAWARTETPRCLVALGLRLPCTEGDVLRAYRRRVKRLHPDRGGEQRQFMQLQADFEQAVAYLRETKR
jgi:hypothetical protein